MTERTSRLLVLMRHAEAADFATGRRDRDRPLTDRGHAQAAEAASRLAGLHLDLALVSGARRTRETAADLELACPVDHLDQLYNADPATIRGAIADAYATTGDDAAVLVVAHNPGIHQLVLELADLGSTPDGARLAYSFPTATAVGLRVDADLSGGAPVAFVHLSRA